MSKYKGKEEGKQCSICNNSFTPNSNRQKYCSPACKDVAQKENKQRWNEENKEKIKEYSKQYHEKNAERINRYRKQHYQENKERYKLYNKQYYEKNAECINRYSKQYRQENKEYTKEYGKQHYQENKEYYREHSKQYRQENKEYLKLYDKQYRQENKEKRNEYNKQWRQENKEYIKEYRKENIDRYRQYNQKRKSIKKRLPHTLTLDQWEKIKNDFNNKCAYCGITEQEHKEEFNEQLHQEHFIPLSEGGEYTHNNIIPACRSCNCSKHNTDFFEWYPTYEEYNEEREQFILEYLGYIEDTQQLTLESTFTEIQKAPTMR